MLTWNFGPCRRRSRSLEEIDKPDTPEESLSRVFEFLGFINGGIGGNRVVVNFLRDASKNWPRHRPLSILEFHCGRGDLSAAIVRWARKRKIEVGILAVDECQSVITLAREHHGDLKEINFEVRYLSDPRFLEAQQFDFVVSSSALHSLNGEEAVQFLKSSNMLAKHGLIFSDWLRDIRAWLWMQALSRFWGDDIIVHDALLAIRKGFTLKEISSFVGEAGLDYLAIKRHLGYRFSVAGVRALVLSGKTAPISIRSGSEQTRLAGA